MFKVEDFENVLNKVLDSKVECEGFLKISTKEVITISSEEIIDLNREFKFLYIKLPEWINPEYIVLKEGEEIKAKKKLFTPEKEYVISFKVTRKVPSYKVILEADKDMFKIFTEKRNDRRVVGDRAVEIIKSYLKKKYHQ